MRNLPGRSDGLPSDSDILVRRSFALSEISGFDLSDLVAISCATRAFDAIGRKGQSFEPLLANFGPAKDASAVGSTVYAIKRRRNRLQLFAAAPFHAHEDLVVLRLDRPVGAVGIQLFAKVAFNRCQPPLNAATAIFEISFYLHDFHFCSHSIAVD